MANWQWTLDVSKEWEAWDNGTMSTSDVANQLALKLKRLPPSHYDIELQLIIEEFEYNAETQDEFNDALRQLYDWADYSHRLWIKTF